MKLIGLTIAEENILKYVFSDFNALAKKDIDDIDIRIENQPNRSFPITCPKRMNVGQAEDYIIYLCHNSNYWCQMIYQLAHELGHFFMECYPEKENLKWISECLCEFYSFVFLDRSLKYFNANYSYYKKAVKEYIEEHLQKSLSYSNIVCDEFIKQNMVELENDPTEDRKFGRPRNNYIAVKIFEKLGCNGKGLSAICIFSELNKARTSKEFFELWLQKCRNDDEKYFVIQIRKVLGL